MSIERNQQVRDDLNVADAVVRACWSNFLATEPTYVLRDLIVIELDKARLAEREACASLAAEVAHHLRGLPSEDASYNAVKCAAGAEACERVATAIRNRSK